MYFTIFTPPSNTSTAPSLCYAPMGYLTDAEALQLEAELQGSLCRIVAFDTEARFQVYLDESDEEFWNQRDYVRHMISTKDLAGMEIHTN